MRVRLQELEVKLTQLKELKQQFELLNEQKIALDPGLSNQIHLINQVRVFSVHKKNTPFNPSKEQAHAILLYTIDIFNKLFEKKV